MPITSDRLIAGLDRAATVFEDALMLETVRVFTRDEGTFNTSTGQWPDPVESELYWGKASRRISQARPVKTIDIGESLNTIREWNLRVPRGTATFPAGAIVEVLESPRSPEMVGQLFRVDDWPEPTLGITPIYKITEYHPRDFEIP